jgi:tetratricopeptide (TPR) repeat protein
MVWTWKRPGVSSTFFGMSAQKNKPQTDSPQKANWNVISIAAALLVVLVIAGSNYHLSQNRALHIVSGFEQVASVEIEGQQALNIQPRTVKAIMLPEGKYRANIKGATNQTVDLNITASFLDRWFKAPAYVLNVGGSGLLIEEDGEKQQYHFGQPFTSLRHADYVFVERPTDAMPGKVRIDFVKGQVGDVFYRLVESEKNEEAMKLAEWHLSLHPEDTGMLPGMATVAQLLKQEPRFRAFLEEGLKKRPVQMSWHRYYQDYLFTPDHLPKLITEYDALIQAEPKDADLLYLRGRLCISKKEAVDFYNRALGLNFNNAYAQFGLASTEASVGSWNLAKPHITMARSMRPDVIDFQDAAFEIQMAMGDFENLESGLAEAVAQNPRDLTLNILLCDVLAAAGKNEAAMKACEAFEKAVADSNQNPGIGFRTRVLYSIGDFEALAKLTASEQSEGAQTGYFEAMVEQGKLNEALSVSPIDAPESRNPFHFIALSIALKAASDEEKAAACMKRAIDLLGFRPDYARMAEFLKQPGPVRLMDVLDVPLTPKFKAIVMVALAQKYPLLGKDFLAAARRLNVDRSYPYHMLNRLTSVTEARAEATN